MPFFAKMHKFLGRINNRLYRYIKIWITSDRNEIWAWDLLLNPYNFMECSDICIIIIHVYTCSLQKQTTCVQSCGYFVVGLCKLTTYPILVKVQTIGCCLWQNSSFYIITPRARMRSRGKVIGLYVCRRHENCQFSRSTRLCVM